MNGLKSAINAWGRGAWSNTDKDEYAQRLHMANRSTTEINGEGICVCKKCGGERMFRLSDFGKSCWLPIVCKCEAEQMERAEREEEINANRDASGISGRQRRITFETFPVNAYNEKAYSQALQYCIHFEEAAESGQGIYIVGATGTYKTLLALCIANMVLDAGFTVKFYEAADLLLPLGGANYDYYRGQSATESAIAECIAADLVVLDNLGDDIKGAGGIAAQRRLAKLIEGRYGKPTVFTSNYEIEELATECGFKINTVDRIREAAARVFDMGGVSHRKKITEEKIVF